jgi:hypothetical protein
MRLFIQWNKKSDFYNYYIGKTQDFSLAKWPILLEGIYYPYHQ